MARRKPPSSAGVGRAGHSRQQSEQLMADSDPLAAIEAVDIATLTSFDELQTLLITAHTAVRHHQGQAVRAAAIAGRILDEVHERLKGTGVSFSVWCEQAGLPRRTAYNYRTIARKLEADPSCATGGTTVRELLGNGSELKALPQTRVQPVQLERFKAAAESRGLKPTELLALIVDDWLDRNEDVIDV